MKYIITENRLQSIVDSYITSQFEKLNPVKAKNNKTVWLDENREPVIIIFSEDDFSEIYLLDDVYTRIYNLFGMERFDEIQSALLSWFEKHMDIKTDEIFTFDNEGHDFNY